MLVLSMRLEESLRLRGIFYRDAAGKFVPVEVFLKLTELPGSTARLGLTAPWQVRADRIDASGHATLKNGVCRYCGCSQQRACALPDGHGGRIGCSWADSGRTVCSNPECLAQAGRDRLMLLSRKEYVR